MREYAPYLLLAAIVAIAYFYRSGALGRLVSAPSPAAPLAAPAQPPLSVAQSVGVLSPITSAILFAQAHVMAREEALEELAAKLASETRKATVAIYQTPFSGPPATEDKPAA